MGARLQGHRASRRAPVPGAHIPVALFLTRGAHNTFPILQLDGRTVGDSTAIIAALEERHPDSPLYPEDPEQRRRALQLEDFFDEELGPHMRLLAFHEMRRDPGRMKALMERTAPGPLAKLAGPSAAYANAYSNLRFRTSDEEAAALAREKIVAALDRLEAELGADEYLVGDGFTVADLTAASLLNPLVLPDGGPLPSDNPPPKGLQSFREPLEGRARLRLGRADVQPPPRAGAGCRHRLSDGIAATAPFFCFRTAAFSSVAADEFDFAFFFRLIVKVCVFGTDCTTMV